MLFDNDDTLPKPKLSKTFEMVKSSYDSKRKNTKMGE